MFIPLKRLGVWSFSVTVKQVIGSSCSVRKSEVAAVEGSGLAGVHCIVNWPRNPYICVIH